ncbi:MAG: hypothetical protein HY313_05080 [Acidobacteria bacterium]|nr:hypothetical protein [Acidobacteriota bacterium]
MDKILEKNQTLLDTFKNKTNPGECNDNGRPGLCAMIQDRFEKAQDAVNKAKKFHARTAPEDFEDLNRQRKGKDRGEIRAGLRRWTPTLIRASGWTWPINSMPSRRRWITLIAF